MGLAETVLELHVLQSGTLPTQLFCLHSLLPMGQAA